MPYNDPTPEPEVNESPQLNKATRTLAVFYIALPFVLIYLLFKIFPPNPWPPDPWVQVFFLFKAFSVWTTQEERLILLVIVAGALGSYIHAATSYSDYRGNRQFNHSWLLWYLLRPFVGVCLSLIVYFAVRGGLLSMVLSGETANEAKNINPFGVAAIAGLTGMFSKQAADKLAEVFSTLFKSQGDSARKDSLTEGSTVAGVDPTSGPVAGGNRLTITGTGFSGGAKVVVGGNEAANVEVIDDTTIKADAPAGEAGTVDVEVVSSTGQKSTKPKAYTYTASDAGDGGDGGGGDSEGGAHDTELKPDTPDEDLPITEGGVE